MARGKNASTRCLIVVKSFLYLSYHHCGHLQDEATHQTKYVQVDINNENINQGANAINQ
jgi:hypothetical protein